MQIIAVANQKGGVGKTTTSTVLASGLYSKGHRVLLCDLDPQTNASFMTGVDVLSVANLYDVFKGEKTVEETIVPVRLGFDLLPGSLLLAAADSEFTQTGREYMLKEALDSIKEQYDYIVIDTPPTLGILVTNALTAANKLIIPVGAGDIFSLQGLTQFYGIIQNVRKYCNHELQIAGLLITRYNSRSNVNQALKGQVQQIAEQMETKVFKAAIIESVSVKESQLHKEDLFEQAPRSNAAKDYQAFICEFLEGEV